VSRKPSARDERIKAEARRLMREAEQRRRYRDSAGFRVAYRNLFRAEDEDRVLRGIRARRGG
jgi:hypothetical protein